MIKLVLLRHGESLWNKENRFTGWIDVGLTEKGKKEAEIAGQTLKKEGYSFDCIFTSVLKRATQTTELVLREMALANIPLIKDWRLNERHYGNLQGLNKAETAAKYGEEQVKIWRRSYAVRPPGLSPDDPTSPAKDPLYQNVDPKQLPLTESLADVVNRVLPCWEKEIAPLVKKGKRVLISAHGNSLRALIKYLDNLSEKEIEELNLPTGIPLVYELDENLKPLKHYYLGQEENIRLLIEEVKNQGKTAKTHVG
ncbi:MAG: 2,3-bisphosphoglycerate-dependent phosphoglycerate mutase [Microgenomates group bacterium ADurb.Bin219]|nr:MAG: 2,3-bisphosphoglycerate-dependent phosphoglycerate mutase [Microgenomates group bacterium ADurb.Bin219]HNP89474.1 2,3-diphosphoglycerate-dependent phosphoglycerate mutase [Candidatus Woesebacteria bacterium]